MLKIKTCGIRDPATATAAAEASADYIGLVFASSQRQVTTTLAREIVSAVKGKVQRPMVVGVFVKTPANEVNNIADYCSLDLVQLSGEETWWYCLDIERPIIKTIHVNPGMKPSEVTRIINEGIQVLAGRELHILLDTASSVAYGGTGHQLDWSVAQRVSGTKKIILAGGLTPENVSSAVREVKPWGIDVSSGIETGGRKDVTKIRSFITAARIADRMRA